jgi:hypothetical protein
MRFAVSTSYFLPILIVGLCALGHGCSSTSEEANNATKRWLTAQAARDASVLWEMLSTEHKRQIESLFDEIKRLDALVQSQYPDSQQVRSSLGIDVLDTCNDAASLFAALVARSGEAQVLSLFQQLGLRAIRQTEVTNGQSVQTLGGDLVVIVEEDGELRVRLSEEDSLRIQTLLNVIEQTRQSLDEQVRLIGEKRL